MENINIEATDDSPKVTMDYAKGLIEFEGECYPENTFEFFEPILEWIKAYFDGNTQDITTVNFKLTYFNSATTQILFDIFDELEEAECDNLNVNWFYDENNKNTLTDYEEFSEEFESLNIQAIKK